MRFDGKCVVVAGGGSGIGRAAAGLLALRGARVAVVDQNGKLAEETAAAIRNEDGDAAAYTADISKFAEIDAAVSSEAERSGGIDALIVSAGIQRYGNALDTSEEEWDRVLDVNLKGAWLAARAALPYLIVRQGAIVNVSSVQGMATQKNVLAYTVSKHGMLGLTRSMAVDFAPNGVRVNAVCPGTVDTPMLEWSAGLAPDPAAVYEACAAMHPLGRIARPEEIAHVILFLAHPNSSFVTGSAWTVDGGLLTLLGGSPKG